MATQEINFDGIVGPTHNYAGLSYGNVASITHRDSVSSPKQAALEGLAKMRFLASMGVPQAVLPPHERPHVPTLRRYGFTGPSDADVLDRACRENPRLLAAASSASAMWAANAATVSPSADTSDARVHFTPANLAFNFHRSIEAPTTTRVLRAIFADAERFVVHDPLPPELQDEGAANHTRLCPLPGSPGYELFTYGRVASDLTRPGPVRFPARHTLEASHAVAQRHLLDPARVVFVQQNPAAIDAGAFHNDVVAVGSDGLMLHHERAWTAVPEVPGVQFVAVAESAVPLTDAVATYLFNSQLVTLPDGTMSLIAPVECRDHPRAHGFIQDLLARRDTPVRSVRFVDVRQSMRNGGGPACLRLRVVLTDDERAALRGDVILTDASYERLNTWVARHYRDELRPDDLRDPRLLDESRAALDELSQILRLGPVYDFQRT